MQMPQITKNRAIRALAPLAPYPAPGEKNRGYACGGHIVRLRVEQVMQKGAGAAEEVFRVDHDGGGNQQQSQDVEQ